ncbi:MAG: relaxase/mobilization nuclease domain-containing protein [Acidobacteria bacterium]|nr:relaxase/mobilization nuclease domain-containing protein [Acidobacteriota bacterium]
MIDERPIVFRPRRPKGQEKDESKVWAKAFKNLIRVVRMTSKGSGSIRGRRQGRGMAGSSQTSYRQRCAVRVTYSGNRVRGQWAAHGRYIVRDSAVHIESGTGSPGFDGNGVVPDVPAKLREWQSAGDPRMFKLIVSPEFGERVDIKNLVRETMTGMEADLGRHLEWVAVVHSNTQHLHAHVALRGVADKDELRLDRDYVKHGIRRRAEDECTVQLGFRTHQDALEAAEREVGQVRFTSLDRQIARSRPAAGQEFFRFDLSGRSQVPLRNRLFVLQELGLARRADEHAWDVKSDFDAVLRGMQKVSDRQRMIAAYGSLLSSPMLPTRYTPPNEISELTGRVVGHAQDDGADRPVMILEGADGFVHIVPHDQRIERYRVEGRLAVGKTVSLKSVCGKLRVQEIVCEAATGTEDPAPPRGRYPSSARRSR